MLSIFNSPFLLFLFLLFLLFSQINALIFYYNVDTNLIDIIEYKYKNHYNPNIFIFLPGTSAKCKNYSQLFYSINNNINILCINYINDIQNSIQYYNYHSFIDKSNLLKIQLRNALKKIKYITGINYLNKINAQIKWNNIIAAGHSQGSVITTVWAKKYNLYRLVLFSGPSCQFNKRLHSWLKKPFSTKISNIYAIESLQDKILPWYHGNKHFGCKKQDSVKNYIKSIGINLNKIQIISPFKKFHIKKKNTNFFIKYSYFKWN